MHASINGIATIEEYSSGTDISLIDSRGSKINLFVLNIWAELFVFRSPRQNQKSFCAYCYMYFLFIYERE